SHGRPYCHHLSTDSRNPGTPGLFEPAARLGTRTDVCTQIASAVRASTKSARARTTGDVFSYYAKASLHQAKALQFGGRLGHLIAGVLSLHPFEQFWYALLHRNPRLEAEQRAGASNVGHAVADVAFAVLACDLRLDSFAQTLGQHPHHFFDRSRVARADVGGLVICAVGFERQQVGLNNVADVDEIARLFAVLEDHRLLVVQQPRREDGADAGVRIRQRLARPVNVEITQRDCRYAISPPDDQAELLLILLRDGVDRRRNQRLLFGGSDRRQNRAGSGAERFPLPFDQLARRTNRRVNGLAVGVAISPFAVNGH